MKANSTVMLVKVAALVVLSVFLVFWVYMGLGAMSGGDWGGTWYIVGVAAALALMALAWQRPSFWGGIILMAGALIGLWFAVPMWMSDAAPLPGVLASVPFVICGILLLLAGQMERRHPARRASSRG